MKRNELTPFLLALLIALAVIQAAATFSMKSLADKNRSVIITQSAVIARQKLVIDTLKAKTADFAEELQWYQEHLENDCVITDSTTYLNGDGTWKSVDTTKTEGNTPEEVTSASYLCSAD